MEYMNKIEKRNELINKNTFESLNKNISKDYNNDLNQIDIIKKLKKDFSSESPSINKEIFKHKQLNLNYEINNNL